MNVRLCSFIATAVIATVPHGARAGVVGGFTQTNLVSDGAAPAVNPADPQLKNPWGIAFSGGSPFWVSDNATGVSTLYNSLGAKQGLVVTIPGAGGGQGTPTGIVFSAVSTAFNGDTFVFASEDGLITGWRGALGGTAEVLKDNSASAVYKGLAINKSGSDVYLFAANFHNNSIDVLASAGAPALAGTFTDPALPAGYAPFDVQKIGNLLYVTYAVQDAAKHDDVRGAGNGIVDAYNLDGTLNQRLITKGNLNSPWGIALAPAAFAPLGGDLLIGNFGDGLINAYTPAGVFVGTLGDKNGAAMVNEGLWALTFGNGGNGGNVNSLYFTAGINGEADGLFGRIDAVPEPATLAMLFSGAVLLAMSAVKRSRSRRV